MEFYADNFSLFIGLFEFIHFFFNMYNNIEAENSIIRKIFFFEENEDKTIKLVKKINSLIIPYIKNKDDKKTNITENNSQKNNISRNLTITYIRSSENHLTIDSLNKSENKCKNNYEQNKNKENNNNKVNKTFKKRVSFSKIEGICSHIKSIMSCKI